MYETIISMISDFGYIGILLLIAIENIFPPIPSEVILTFSGFVAKDANLNIILIVIYATLGSVIGAIILYLLGYILNKTFFQKLIDTRLGKVLHLNKDDINKSIHLFKEKGYKSVFYSRLVPIIRSLISIPAGMSKMNFPKFILLTTIGSAIWNTILILLGVLVGKNYLIVATFISKYYKLLFIIIIIIYLLKRYLKSKRITTMKSFD